MNKFLRGFVYAFNGIWHAAATQLNFRVHLVCALIAVFAGYAFQISSSEWLWVIFCIGMVLVAELFNTAIEFLTDLVSPEYNKKAGLVKDMAAGAVLITAIAALIIGLVIFVPKLLALIHHAA
ncbi:MAG: diacylglycerol kinase family protein [Mucilaginibacter sp.]|nr:diacylglycerol kinase family protein [Mucilaginibacter sp.]